MAEIMDRRAVFTIVMGCDGAGKSAWKRANYDRLPRQYFDQDSIAGGVGDWNDEEARQRARRIVQAEIESCFAQGESFGTESTFSGQPGPALMARAAEMGYRVEGYYIGTASWEVNASRIDYRVLSNTGHYVDPKQLPQRYHWSLSNLRKRLHDFDFVEVADNTEESMDRIPEPVVSSSRRRELSRRDCRKMNWRDGARNCRVGWNSIGVGNNCANRCGRGPSASRGGASSRRCVGFSPLGSLAEALDGSQGRMSGGISL